MTEIILADPAEKYLLFLSVMDAPSLLKCDVIDEELLTKAFSIQAGVRLSCFWLSSPQDCLQSIKQIIERMSCPGTTLAVWKAGCLGYAQQERRS